MLEDQMNVFYVNFERLILGKFPKGSEHLKINSLYFYDLSSRFLQRKTSTSGNELAIAEYLSPCRFP
jgi:hypothetical protein